MSLQTQLISDPSYFASHAQEWQELLTRSESQPFFMEPSYQAAWWEHLGHGELSIIEIRENNKLVGLLPLFKDLSDGQEKWRIVGAVEESDYLDAVVDKDQLDTIYEALAVALTDKLNATNIWLECLTPHSKTLSIFTTILTGWGWTVTQEQQDETPKVLLPQSMSEYYLSLDPKTAKHLQKQVRAIGEDDEIKYECITETSLVREKIPNFIELHKASSPEKARFWTTEREAFFSDMASDVATAGYMRLYYLYVNKDPAASAMIFDYRNEFLGYNSGFNAYRYGHMAVSNVLSMYVTEDAIKLKRKTLDFMRGDEAYKLQMGAKAEPLYDLKMSLDSFN